jgi:DNA-binding HxlR family transcriptional regulator
LLRYDPLRHTFKITEKGHKFLEIYKEMEDMLKETKEEEYGLVNNNNHNYNYYPY